MAARSSGARPAATLRGGGVSRASATSTPTPPSTDAWDRLPHAALAARARARTHISVATTREGRREVQAGPAACMRAEWELVARRLTVENTGEAAQEGLVSSSSPAPAMTGSLDPTRACAVTRRDHPRAGFPGLQRVRWGMGGVALPLGRWHGARAWEFGPTSPRHLPHADTAWGGGRGGSHLPLANDVLH